MGSGLSKRPRSMIEIVKDEVKNSCPITALPNGCSADFP